MEVAIDKPYFHELTDEQVNELLASHITWGELVDRFAQPEWCNYHNALMGEMGCWSLVDMRGLRKEISLDYCKSCDCCRKMQ